MVKVTLIWGRKKWDLNLQLESTYGELQTLIYTLTGVAISDQKILLRYKGEQPGKGHTLSELNVRENSIINVIGVPQNQAKTIKKLESTVHSNMIVDDLNWKKKFSSVYSIVDITEATLNLSALLQETKGSDKFYYINPPRDTKPLIVLDLDHTLLHFSSKQTRKVERMMRPYMHEFLSRVYKHYDICIWSQTKWSWVEIKLYELGMLTHPNYRLCFALDDSHTTQIRLDYTTRSLERYRKQLETKGANNVDFSITPEGKVRRFHSVKPLQLIWELNNKWNASNTIHIDDLEKNFVYNPQSGFVCSQYVRKNSKKDKELIEIAGYLEHIVATGLPFDKFDHRAWRQVMLDRALQQLSQVKFNF